MGSVVIKTKKYEHHVSPKKNKYSSLRSDMLKNKGIHMTISAAFLKISGHLSPWTVR